MTTPDSGATRPGRAAGLALLGLAVVALVLGLITALGGSSDGEENADRPPEPPATTKSSATAQPPATTTTKPQQTTRPPATTTTTTPPGSGTNPPGGDNNGEPTKSIPVRVLNNSKIKGLAKKAADDFQADGWQIAGTGNFSAKNLPETTVFYRPGTEEEASAKALATAFGLASAPRIPELAGEPAGIVVIVTNDYDNQSQNK